MEELATRTTKPVAQSDNQLEKKTVSVNNEVELKGGMYTFMSLKLHTSDLNIIDARLADKVQQAPGFFKDTPVVVDLSVIESLQANSDGDQTSPIPDLSALFERIRAHKLVPIVASVADKSSPFAAAIELPLIESGAGRVIEKQSSTDTTDSNDSKKSVGLNASTQQTEAATGQSDSSATDQLQAELATAKQVEVLVKAPMLLKRPVRSGQQVYARETDLIIMGQVGAGAEVLADHNIHVYGPLRGRALCGVSGNTSTRIFCQSLEAELVSVAGNFRVLEEIPADLRGKPAQIWLDKDKLNIEPLVDTNLSGVIA